MENVIVPQSSLCRPGPDERRVMCRSLLRWEMLRTDEQLPLDGALDPDEDPGLTPHLYRVRLLRPASASTLHQCGQELAWLCHDYSDGATVGTTLPIAVRERMIDFMGSAASYRQPLADSGDFLGPDGRDVMYRNIVMPMQDPTGLVVGIVGAFSYRIMQ